MRITVSHNKPKEQIVKAVDRSFDDLFRGNGVIPIEIVNEQRVWTGSTLTFSFTAKMGFIGNPIKGTVEVTDRDLTIDADLGVLEKLLGGKQAQSVMESRVKGLLT